MKTSSHDYVNYKSILITLVLVLAAFSGLAWGGNMLDSGDEALLAPPAVDFLREMKILPLPRAKFQAQNSTDLINEAAQAETDELESALRKNNIPKDQRALILDRFLAERTKLSDFRFRLKHWKQDPHYDWTNGNFVELPGEPRPTMAGVDTSALDDVPLEFVDYLQGSAAWYQQETNEARACWEAIVHRPAAERHYRSTWAAYMLGRSWMHDDPDTAIGYFEQVRLLKLHGFPDSLGLAAASLGEEARVLLNEKKYEAAIRLYIEQLAAGSESAGNSLRFAVRDALDADNFDLTVLATNRATRRVVNAFLISNGDDNFADCIISNRPRWLALTASADVHDPASAEQLALMAYKAKQWDLARRWISMTPQSPTGQWLRVKLFLRDGKAGRAAEALEQMAELFPRQEPDDDALRRGGLENALYVTFDRAPSACDEILGEAGALRLAKGNYTGALDDFLRGRFPMDADYVAERVLTLAELKTYVDQNWPALAASETNDPVAGARQEIRWLLGRRLARAGELEQARPYYPAEQLASFDSMVTNLDAAHNEGLSNTARKDACWAAAEIFRTNGMDLLGTEMWPDWHSTGGSLYAISEPLENRRETNSILTTAGQDEIARTRDGVDSTLRYHYRYQAAGLAWDAARLMEPGSEEQARTLCEAGTWIKYLDPMAANPFYKALVLNCGETAIGKQAEHMHWFPILDDNGAAVPPPAPAPLPAPMPGISGGIE